MTPLIANYLLRSSWNREFEFAIWTAGDFFSLLRFNSLRIDKSNGFVFKKKKNCAIYSVKSFVWEVYFLVYKVLLIKRTGFWKTNRICKLTQDCKTRDVRISSVAEWIHHSAHKFCHLANIRKFYLIYEWLALNLCRIASGGQTVKHLVRLTRKFELNKTSTSR